MANGQGGEVRQATRLVGVPLRKAWRLEVRPWTRR